MSTCALCDRPAAWMVCDVHSVNRKVEKVVPVADGELCDEHQREHRDEIRSRGLILVALPMPMTADEVGWRRFKDTKKLVRPSARGRARVEWGPKSRRKVIRRW